MINSQPYRAVLFDLDGTLIDSTEAIVTSTLAALDELGWQAVARQVIVDHIGYKFEALFPQRSVAERRCLIDTIGRHYDTVCTRQSALYPGIRELLDHLAARGIPMGVVTSKRHHHSEAILSALGVRGHFGVLICSDDVTRMKPDPEGLIAAMGTLSVSPTESLYVGDTVVDVQTARRAGVAVAGVDWGTDGLERLTHPQESDLGVDHGILVVDDLYRLF